MSSNCDGNDNKCKNSVRSSSVEEFAFSQHEGKESAESKGNQLEPMKLSISKSGAEFSTMRKTIPKAMSERENAREKKNEAISKFGDFSTKSATKVYLPSPSSHSGNITASTNQSFSDRSFDSSSSAFLKPRRPLLPSAFSSHDHHSVKGSSIESSSHICRKRRAYSLDTSDNYGKSSEDSPLSSECSPEETVRSAAHNLTPISTVPAEIAMNSLSLRSPIVSASPSAFQSSSGVFTRSYCYQTPSPGSINSRDSNTMVNSSCRVISSSRTTLSSSPKQVPLTVLSSTATPSSAAGNSSVHSRTERPDRPPVFISTINRDEETNNLVTTTPDRSNLTPNLTASTISFSTPSSANNSHILGSSLFSTPIRNGGTGSAHSTPTAYRTPKVFLSPRTPLPKLQPLGTAGSSQLRLSHTNQQRHRGFKLAPRLPDPESLESDFPEISQKLKSFAAERSGSKSKREKKNSAVAIEKNLQLHDINKEDGNCSNALLAEQEKKLSSFHKSNKEEESDEIAQEMDGLLRGFETAGPQKSWQHQETENKPTDKRYESSNSLTFSIDDSSIGSGIARFDSLESFYSNSSSKACLQKWKNGATKLTHSVAATGHNKIPFGGGKSYTDLPVKKVGSSTPQISNTLLMHGSPPGRNLFESHVKGSNETCDTPRSCLSDSGDESGDFFFLEDRTFQTWSQCRSKKQARCRDDTMVCRKSSDSFSDGNEDEKFSFKDFNTKLRRGSSKESSSGSSFALGHDGDDAPLAMSEEKNNSQDEVSGRDLVTPPLQVDSRKGKSMFSPPLLVAPHSGLMSRSSNLLVVDVDEQSSIDML